MGRRKGAKDGAKYRAQKHAADQALLVVLISHKCGSCTSWRAKQGPTAQRLSELTSKAHTKISTSFLVRVSYLLKILSGPDSIRRGGHVSGDVSLKKVFTYTHIYTLKLNVR